VNKSCVKLSVYARL